MPYVADGIREWRKCGAKATSRLSVFRPSDEKECHLEIGEAGKNGFEVTVIRRLEDS